MDIAKTLDLRHYDSYIESPSRPGKTAQEISGSISIDANPFAPPANADAITAAYPSNSVEVFYYRQGGDAGTILKIVTITYTNSNKKDLLKVEVS